MAEATIEKKARRKPQPRNFDTFAIMFSDGTYIICEAHELPAKLSESTKIINQEDNADLTFEVRGVSRRIKSVRQKATSSAKFDLSGETPVMDVTGKGSKGLEIVYED